MTPVLFAQALGEYVSIAGIVNGLRLAWSDVERLLQEVETTTWLGLGAILLVLFVWRSRR